MKKKAVAALLAFGLVASATLVPIEAQAAANVEKSVISSLQTEPRLVAGESLTVNVWLMDANGNLQYDGNQPVYVWLEDISLPGVMSPAFQGGSTYKSLQARGGVISREKLTVTRAGDYTLHASLQVPSPGQVAAGSLPELANTDVYQVHVEAGQVDAAQRDMTIRMNLPASYGPIELAKAGAGQNLTFTLTHSITGNLAAGYPVSLRVSDPNGVAVTPSTTQTDANGNINLNLKGLRPGSYRLTIQANGMEQYVSLHVASQQGTYFINRATAVLNNQEVALDAVPVVRDGRTYVPLRSLAEGFGSDVRYADGRIDIQRGQSVTVMYVGSPSYSVNGVQGLSMDAVPYLDWHSGRTMVPLRFVIEGLGFGVVPVYDSNGLVQSVQVYA